MERFRTDWGTIFQRPPAEEIKIEDIVGIVGKENNIEITGRVVGKREECDGLYALIEVGGSYPIPRKMEELAVPAHTQSPKSM